METSVFALVIAIGHGFASTEPPRTTAHQLKPVVGKPLRTLALVFCLCRPVLIEHHAGDERGRWNRARGWYSQEFACPYDALNGDPQQS